MGMILAVNKNGKCRLVKPNEKLERLNRFDIPRVGEFWVFKGDKKHAREIAKITEFKKRRKEKNSNIVTVLSVDPEEAVVQPRFATFTQDVFEKGVHEDLITVASKQDEKAWKKAIMSDIKTNELLIKIVTKQNKDYRKCL